jgi:hypothetical protein
MHLSTSLFVPTPERGRLDQRVDALLAHLARASWQASGAPRLLG